MTTTPCTPFGPGSHAPIEDGSQPEGYDIKGNDDSMLYHRPDSRSYQATIAEVWFDSEESAQAAGFSLANTHPRGGEHRWLMQRSLTTCTKSTTPTPPRWASPTRSWACGSSSARTACSSVV